jgi:hypothetical protein
MGLIVLTMMIAFVSVLKSSMQLSTLLFLKTSETFTGESDFQIAPASASSSTIEMSLLQRITINFTEIDQNFCTKVKGVVGCSPRWEIPGTIRAAAASSILPHDEGDFVNE